MTELDDHDSAMIILRTASGKLCHINNTRAAVYGYDQRIELHGNQGMLLSNNNRVHNLEKSTAKATAVKEPLEDFFIDRYMKSYELEVQAFIEAISNNKPLQVTYNDGVRDLQLAEAAYRSLASGSFAKVEQISQTA